MCSSSPFFACFFPCISPASRLHLACILSPSLLPPSFSLLSRSGSLVCRLPFAASHFVQGCIHTSPPLSWLSSLSCTIAASLLPTRVNFPPSRRRRSRASFYRLLTRSQPRYLFLFSYFQLSLCFYLDSFDCQENPFTCDSNAQSCPLFRPPLSSRLVCLGLLSPLVPATPQQRVCFVRKSSPELHHISPFIRHRQHGVRARRKI